MGIVTSERNISQRIEQLYERRDIVTPLALAEVVHASFIDELVRSLRNPKMIGQKVNEAVEAITTGTL
jgi:hypothetical protein